MLHADRRLDPGESMNHQEFHQSYPASQIEPGWHLLINEQWVAVGIVIETETPDGTHFITFVFDEDTKLPAVKLRKEAMVTAQPPDLPPTSSPVA